MAEYIEREALKREISKLEVAGIFTASFKKAVLDIISEQPIADVTDVRHGNWEDKVRKGFGAFSGRCSKCKKYSGLWVVNEPYRFCPYCGAKMDLGGN